MVVVGLMSGVLSNTGTAAVLIPVVIGVAAKSGYFAFSSTDAAGFAAALGGNLSPLARREILSRAAPRYRILAAALLFEYA